MRLERFLAIAATAMLGLAAMGSSAHAPGSVVIYRCTNVFGAVTIQNDVPCPKGSHEERKVVDVPPPMPAYRSPEPAPPPAPVATPEPPSPPLVQAEPEPTIADADRLPPPPLFRCNTYDNDSYLSDTASPPPRCVRMQTVGLDGSTGSGAGVACQMVNDQCQRVPDGSACDAWKQRERESLATWKFAPADDGDVAKAEYERVHTIVRQSTCGQ